MTSPFRPLPIVSDRVGDARFHAILLAYIDDLARLRAHLPRLAASGDATAVVRCAHRLSGTAPAYGYPALGTAAANLEHSVANDGLAQAWSEIDVLVGLLDRVLAGAPTLVTAAA